MQKRNLVMVSGLKASKIELTRRSVVSTEMNVDN